MKENNENMKIEDIIFKDELYNKNNNINKKISDQKKDINY